MLSRVATCAPAPSGGITVAVSLVFAVALLVALSPRAALGASIVALNLLFAWTSRLLEAVSPVTSMVVSRLISLQDHSVWRVAGLSSAQLSATATDVEGLVLLVSIAALTAHLSAGSSARKAVNSLGLASGLLVILGAEVALFDAGALFQHVTTLQGVLGLAPWFTNADLIASGVASLTVFALVAGHRL